MAESSSSSLVTNNINIQTHSSEVKSEECTEDKKTDKVMEPMLLEDYKINEEPRTLLNLLLSLKYENRTSTLSEVMSGLIYILMMESGFVPSGNLSYQDDNYDFNYRRILDLSSHLPKNWRRDNFCSLAFILPPSAQYVCQVSCIPSADDLLVNCVIRSVTDANFNMILDPLTYVVNYSEDPCNIKFQHLKGLSRTFKEQIAFPAKCAILTELDVKFECLPDLPHELLLYILEYLNAKDLTNFSKCCKLFRRLAQEPKLWKRLLLKDFHYSSATKKTYHELFEEYTRLIRVQQAMTSRIGFGRRSGRAVLLVTI